MESVSGKADPCNVLTLPVPRNPHLPWRFRAIRWLFPKLESVAPRYAHQWFVRLFFSPPRYPLPLQEKTVIGKAQRFKVNTPGGEVECYSWGDGPVVLFVHGWAGRGSQFRSFIPSFTAQGYRAVSFDAPAHGLSKGSQTSIIAFRDALMAVEKAVGEVEAIVAHSLGGSASLFAMCEGLKAPTLITIATPTIAEEIIQEFARRLGGSEDAKLHLRMSIHQRFNRPFEEFMATHFICRLPEHINFFVIHDDDDREVSPENAKQLVTAYPSAGFMKTSGLGHVRILRDERVIETCLNFINAHLPRRLLRGGTGT
ncbi:MAG TPA: alpha/beta hydrolase [Ohtaekwangia sp.]|nr:alpha/beta hydrolase [Ohtaekwangia sp.]